MVGQWHLNGKRERGATGWGYSMPMRSYMGHHGHLLAPALQDQAGAADHPCRGSLSEDSTQCSGKPGERMRYRISSQVSYAWNRWGSGKICIWSKSYVSVYHLRSHRNTKYLKPVFELALQYSLPLSSTSPLPSLIWLGVKVWVWVCHHRFCLYPTDRNGTITFFWSEDERHHAHFSPLPVKGP